MGAEHGASLGEFFMVDRRVWIKACERGLNQAVAYLVLARGTARDNCTTSWSIDAIERYTGISRRRAKEAVSDLKAAGLIDQLEAGTRPRYRLRKAEALGASLSDAERAAIQKPATTRKRLSSDELHLAHKVHMKGLAILEGGRYRLKPQAVAEPEWIWLPNQIVTGAAKEVPPLELIRQTRDALLLRLFVELYSVQDLVSDGGIPRSFMYRKYTREKAGQQGECTVWAFALDNEHVWETDLSRCHYQNNLPQGQRAKCWFDRTGTLDRLGLLEWVPHLYEGDDKTAELIHPCGMSGTTSLDDRLGRAAYRAGTAMITEGQLERITNSFPGEPWFVPVRHHINQVQMIGIARLRYRPRTSKTAAWFAEYQEMGETWIKRYEELSSRTGLSAAA
jgi:hypothetical protein